MRRRGAVFALQWLLCFAVGTGLSGAPAHAAAPEGEWPLVPPPVVVSGFDPPEKRWGAGHRGVDLAGRVGQVVRSVLPGRVSFAARLAGRGVVVIDHGPTRTTYEPVVADVAVGTRVAAGDPLGRLELAGSHCLPRACLHWGWRRGEVYLDPLRLVGGGPVRLLPLDGTVAVDAGRPVPPRGQPPRPLPPAGRLAASSFPPLVARWFGAAVRPADVPVDRPAGGARS